MRKVDRYYFKAKEVLVLRREKSEPSKNSTSPLTSQDKMKSWRWQRPEQQAGNQLSFTLFTSVQ